MKQELYKKMYQQICMTQEQKDSIWQRIQSEESLKEKKVRFGIHLPARAAVCAGMLLVSGMTVLAAGEFSVMDRLAEAMGFFAENEQELTEEQKTIFARYGTALGNEIAMSHGTLKLDAALYDGGHLFIPFRYAFQPDTDGYAELKAGTDIRKTSIWKSGTVTGYDQDIGHTGKHRLSYRIRQDTTALTGSLTKYQYEIEEDGVLSGSVLLSTNGDRLFTKGDVIEVVRHVQELGKEEQIEVLAEFTLENAVEQIEVPLDTQTRSGLEDMGVTVEKMTISPLSLQYAGSGTHRDITHMYMEVVLKDGSTVADMRTGYDFDCTASEREIASVHAGQFFAAPVLPEEIAGVRVWNYKTEDVWIPVEDIWQDISR
ncbi:MAG: hypothetical protein K2N73_16900 [Lachnospiraceae bacterium]|nr:hypothetical protein [Lachnospiraceae bacterium]